MSINCLCRSCAKPANSIFPLFTHQVQNQSLKDLLIFCTSLTASEDDNLPNIICEDCVKILLLVYEFIKTCKKSDEYFRNLIAEKEPETDYCAFTEEINIETLSEPCESLCLESVEDIVVTEEKESKKKTQIQYRFQCHICGDMFKKSSSLTYHLKIHSNSRPFECKICQKNFVNFAQLKVHNRSHNGSKPHSCQICKKAFSKSSNLKVHLLIHSKEKPFICNVCERGFSQFVHLENHKRLHTGHRPYKCKKCDLSFVTKTHLERHFNSHLGIRNFLCNECGKAFVSRADLNRHANCHSDKKTFHCQQCFKYFAHGTSLKKHQKKFHK